MKILYIGNVLTQKKVEELNLSIAGKKYELALLKSIDDLIKKDLEIISKGRVAGEKLKYTDWLFSNKKYKVLYKSTLPVVSDFVLNINFLLELLRWTITNLKQPKSVIILNSPFGISLLLVVFKIIFRVKIFSLTIDTPFISENKFAGILGLYTKTKFKLGHKLLHHFSGIAVLNLNVTSVLKLKIPVHLTKIGYDASNCSSFSTYHKNPDKFTLVYVGTLMKFKGVDKLMEAVTQMDNNIFELIICGDGPLKDEVILFSEKYDNIIYKGRVYAEELDSVLSKADLLVNIVEVNNSIEDFGFPSKLIDYILSARPIMTNRFSALPIEFADFVHVFDDDSEDGIKSAILNVFNKPEDELNIRCRLGYMHINEHYTYQKISEGFLAFMNNTSI